MNPPELQPLDLRCPVMGDDDERINFCIDDEIVLPTLAETELPLSHWAEWLAPASRAERFATGQFYFDCGDALGRLAGGAEPGEAAALSAAELGERLMACDPSSADAGPLLAAAAERVAALAWRVNDVAATLNAGARPADIRCSRLRGIVADWRPDDEWQEPDPNRPPAQIPPDFFDGFDDDDEPASADDDEALHLWPEGSGSIRAMLDSPPPALTWFSDERLLADRAHLLVGMGGSSKTRVLIQLGIAAVTGRLAWDWKISRTGYAVLLLAEDTVGGFHRTLAAIRAHDGLTPAELRLLSDRLTVFPMAGHDTKLLAIQPGGVLVETSHFTGLVERCRRVPDLVFIGLDPALGLTEGNENDQAHQRRLGELADRLAINTGACVVLVAHAAKSLQSADEVGSHSSRGAGSLVDAVRGEFTLRTMTAVEAREFGISDTEERKSHVQLLATKGNELPPSAYVPVWLKRGPGGVLHQVTLEAGCTAPSDRERRALAILRQLAAVSAPPLKEWRSACSEAGILTGDTDRNRERCMERIRDTLRDHGLMEPGTGRGIWVPAEPKE